MTEEAPPEQARWKRWLWTMVRVTVAGGVLAFTLSRTPTDDLSQALSRITLGQFLIGTAILMVCHSMGAIRWRWTLMAYGAKPQPMLELLRLYFIGVFFNTYVPGGLGGDVLRAGLTQRALGNATAAWLSILTERALGLAAMLSLVGMLLAFVVPVEGVQTWALLGISGAILAGMVSMPLILGLVANRFGLGQPRVLPLFYAYGISLVSHFLVAVSGHVVISQVAPTTQFIENLVVVPLAQVAVFFPATVGGLGVREAAFVELYSRFGVGAGDAMAGALVFLGLNLASAAVGGLVHVGIGEVKRDG